ncbi:MAG: hypothetical protein C5S52_05240 [ANME-2 cluster archaeon]|nr:hypothetical protein [ANME-2 cluster archaeon]
MPNNNQQPTKLDSTLFDRVATILEQSRANVVRSVNSEMVIAYWLVGWVLCNNTLQHITKHNGR